MGKKVLIISTSLRGGSNSDIDSTFEKAYNGLQGWVDCFEKAELKGIVTGGGINDPSEAVKHTDATTKAYNLGKGL